jgi:hypothetical protein
LITHHGINPYHHGRIASSHRGHYKVPRWRRNPRGLFANGTFYLQGVQLDSCCGHFFDERFRVRLDLERSGLNVWYWMQPNIRDALARPNVDSLGPPRSCEAIYCVQIKSNRILVNRGRGVLANLDTTSDAKREKPPAAGTRN